MMAQRHHVDHHVALSFVSLVSALHHMGDMCHIDVQLLRRQNVSNMADVHGFKQRLSS